MRSDPPDAVRRLRTWAPRRARVARHHEAHEAFRRGPGDALQRHLVLAQRRQDVDSRTNSSVATHYRAIQRARAPAPSTRCRPHPTAISTLAAPSRVTGAHQPRRRRTGRSRSRPCFCQVDRPLGAGHSEALEAGEARLPGDRCALPLRPARRMQAPPPDPPAGGARRACAEQLEQTRPARPARAGVVEDGPAGSTSRQRHAESGVQESRGLIGPSEQQAAFAISRGHMLSATAPWPAEPRKLLALRDAPAPRLTQRLRPPTRSSP